MDPEILKKKIIMEKPRGVQRNIQRFVFWCGNIGKNTNTNKNQVKVAPYKEIKFEEETTSSNI